MDGPRAETPSSAEKVGATATSGNGGEDGQVLEMLHDNGAAEGVSLGDDDRKKPEKIGGAPAQSSQLPYEDHNYIGSSLSTAGSSTKSSGDNGSEKQCFPTIAGLEQYATATDGSPQANNGVAANKRTHHPIQAGAHNNMAVNSHRSHPPLLHPRLPFSTPAGAQSTATVRNSRDYSLPLSGNSPATRRYVVAGAVQQLPFSPAVGARRVMYPSSSDHQFASHAPLGGLSSPQPIRQQLGHPSPQIIQLRRTVGGGSATMPCSTTPTPAMIASDPSLVANLNAPAPFLAPARGPPTRGRGAAPPITSAGRIVVTSHGGGVPVRGGSYQQQMVASSYSRQPAVSGRAPPSTTISQPLQKDTSIHDVLEEEEAQNAQFFQRQMASKKPTAPGTEKQHSVPQTSSSGSNYPSSSAVATASAHLRLPPGDNLIGLRQRGRPPASSLMPPSLLPSPPSNPSSTLMHSESREAALAAAHDFVRQQQQQQQQQQQHQQTAVKSPVKYHIIQTEQHPGQHGAEARQGLPVGGLLQLPQQQQGALEGLAELAQLSQQQQNLFGVTTFGGVSSPQRLLARPAAHNYAGTTAVAYLRTGSPLKHGQQQPQLALPGALSQSPSRHFGGMESALLGTSTPTQNASSNAALMGSAPPPDTTATASSAAGASVRPKRTVSTGKDLQSLIKSSKAEANRHQVTTAADWTGQDYTTRCICGMEHDDDFMIECERCNVWQHGVCMDVDQKNVPDSYFCEQCSPRPLKLTKEEAASLQKEKLKHLETVDSQKTGKAKGKKGADAKLETSKRAFTNTVKNRRASVSGTASHPEKKHHHHNAPENTLSRSMRAYYNAHAADLSKSAKPNDELLKPLRGDVLNAKQMFVAPNVQGLVSVREIAEKSPIIEYTGYFSLASEATGSKAAHRQFLLSYDDLGERINVDASKLGSPARFARRSCKPNTEICHVLDEEGRLHLVLVSNQKIDYSTEVTIPFDYDYTQSTVPVTCACSITQDELKRGEKCPVHDFNLALQGGGGVVGAVANALNSNNNSTPVPIVASPSVADKKSSSQRVEAKRKSNASPQKGVVIKGKGKGKRAKGKKKISTPVGNSSPSPQKNKATEKSAKDLTPPQVKEEEPETRRRPTRTQSTSSNPRVSVPKGAETEAERIRPPAKEQPPSTSTKSANPSSSAKMTVEQQQTAPEPQKLNREERKIQVAMALIERQEQRAKQNLEKKSPKNPTASHEKATQKTQPDKEAKRKDAGKKPAGGKAEAAATPPPSSSHPKGKGGVPKIAFKLKKPAMAPKQQTSRDAARDNSEPEPIAPRRAALKRSATAAALAKIQESSRSPAAKRKHVTSSGSRGRDESQMSSTEAAELLADMATGTSTTPTTTATPSTSRADGGDVNIREDLNELAKFATGAGGELFSLTADYDLMKPSATGLKTPKDGVVGEKKEKEEDEAPTSKFEPAAPIIKPIIANTKAVKKLTIDEYKRRRTSGSSMASPVEGGNGAGPSSSTVASSRHSFIPSLNAPAISLFATPTPVAVVSSVATTSVVRQPGTASVRVVNKIPAVPTRQAPPSTPSSSASSIPTPSLDELKRRIYGGESSNQEKSSITEGGGASTKPTPEATKASKAVREEAEDDDEGDEECRAMSLEERLRTQFGVGVHSSARRPQTDNVCGGSNPKAATRSSTRLPRESFRQPTAYRRQDIPPPGLVTLNHVGGSSSTSTTYPPPTPPSTPVEVPPHSNIYPHQPAR